MAGFNLNSLLNTKSKGAAMQTQEQTAGLGPAEVKERTFEVVMLEVEDLMPSKDNFYTTEGIDELANAIELSGGIEQNLVVKPEAHGKYEVIAGHRRRLAALKLVGEGKKEYRKVPCRIKHESDTIKDKLNLILTNSTARELGDWEKVQQAKELKELLAEYKKALAEENEDRPKEERARMGRIREIVAQMLNTSTTQIGRMEAIENNLSTEFKQEMKKGNINISTAHELSRLNAEGQAKAYEKYEEKGELHIKDVKQEQKEKITDEQAEQAQTAIMEAIKGAANRAVFNAKDIAGVEKALSKHFDKSFKGSRIELEGGGHFIYRFSSEGITLIDEYWKNYLIEYSDLAEIVALMIDNGDLLYDDTPEESQEESREEENTDKEQEEDTYSRMNEPTAAGQVQGDYNEQLPGQQDISSYPEYVPNPQEKGLPFVNWIAKKYGVGQYESIRKEVRSVIMAEVESGEKCPKEWEERITNALSVWVMEKTKEYQQYLSS